MAVERVRFENTTQGFVGAITIDARGERHSIAVEPGGSVELSEEEQLATANAPRRAQDSPFEVSTENEYDDEGNVVRVLNVPPALKAVTHARAIPGSRAIPGVEAPAPAGSYREHEEVGTP